MPRKIAAGNWKMNGTDADLSQIAALNAEHTNPTVEILICPPATLVAQMAQSRGAIAVGGQDCQSNETVAAKAKAAHKANLIAVICIGETLAQREDGTTLNVIDTQLTGSLPDGATSANTVIAYEPVWAIGTGLVPTTDQIAEVHAHIRAKLPASLKDASLLYGGSVKGSNAPEIFAVPNVDGALVGGASLQASDFAPIITALAQS